LQDDSLGAAPMPAPLPAPRVPPGFLPLAAAGGQTARRGGQSMLGTKAGGSTKSPGGQTAPEIEASSLTTHLGGQTIHGTQVGGLTATLGDHTARPYTATSSPTLSTLVAPLVAPMTLVAPHVALASTTLVTPPATTTSQLYP
jgi:hypothetical protein